MIDINNILLVAQKESKESLKNRWFLIYTLSLTILAVLLVYMGSTRSSSLAYSAYGKTAASLINLILLFIPLISLITGSISISSERENKTLSYLLSHPIAKIEVILGKYFGLFVTISLSVFLAFGLSGLFISIKGTNESGLNFIITALLSVFLVASILSVGFLVSVLTSKTSKAIGIAIFLWFLLIVLGDLGIISTSISMNLGARETFFLTIINPVEAYKIASISILTPRFEILGPPGVYAMNFLGVKTLFVILISILSLWIIIPLVYACLDFCRFHREEK